MKTEIAEHLIEQLTRARKAKGLSQRALGDKVGWPQSHVSKFEKGNADIRLSGLVELARALDLEVTLVPRKAVPAVRSVVKASGEDDRTSQALQKIDQVQRTIDRINLGSLPDKTSEAARRLAHITEGLEGFRYNSDTLARLTQALEPATRIAEQLKRIGALIPTIDVPNIKIPAISIPQPALPPDVFKGLESAAREAQALRNVLAHSEYEPFPSAPRPAYRIEEDDDA